MRLATRTVGWRAAVPAVLLLLLLAILMAPKSSGEQTSEPVVPVSAITSVETPAEDEGQPVFGAVEAAEPGPSTSALIGTLVVLGLLVFGLGVWRVRRRGSPG